MADRLVIVQDTDIFSICHKKCDNRIIHLKLLNIAVNHYVQEVFR